MKSVTAALALWWALIACSLDLTFSQVCVQPIVFKNDHYLSLNLDFLSLSRFLFTTTTVQKHRTTQTTVNNNNKPAISASSAFINELHYQNAYSDEGEFVEVVVVTNATKVGGLVLYDGTTGAAYKSLTVQEAITSSPANAAATAPSSSVSYLVWDVADILDVNGPHGMALHDVAGVVLEFISYGGGSFLAIDGVAKGLASKDIIYKQSDDNNKLHSLQRIGTGSTAGDRWVLAPSTRGAVNVLQNFGGCTAVRVFVFSWSFRF
jgi:hypothetical protein